MWNFLIFLHLMNFCSSKLWVQRQIPCDVSYSGTSVIFNCSGRKLSHVPPHISWNVTQLDLACNRIGRISNESFWNLSRLTSLNMNWNMKRHGLKVENQTFAKLMKLQVLHLDGNFLCKVPKDLPTALRTLTLNSNRITSIGNEDFQTTPNLEVFRMNRNCRIGSVCNGSLIIKESAFSQLSHLTNLSLTHNSLTCIPPNLPKTLRELTLHLNRIQYVNKDDLKGLYRLKVLDLSGNCPKCSNAPFPCQPCHTTSGSMEIDADAFRSLSELEELRLSGNSLKKIYSSWFQNITNLKYLYLSFNFLTHEIETGEFLSLLPYVEILDLSFNNENDSNISRIKLADNFSKLFSLRTLHMESYIFRDLLKIDLKPLFGLKNLSVLNLGTNFIENTNLDIFSNFFNLSIIYLSENKLTFSSGCSSNIRGWAELDEAEPGLGRRSKIVIHKDEDYRRYPPSVMKECLNYGPVLDLSNNNIFYFNPKLFRGLESIACLNLSGNSIGVPLNGSEFINFPNLKYIDLSYNKMYLSHNYSFCELKNLEVLDLSYNKHYFVVTGVMHNLAFLKHLQFLKVLNLSWNEISILTDKHMKSCSLQELQFQGNRLDVMWRSKKGYYTLFQDLKNLTRLDISYNMLRHIPTGVYCKFPEKLKYLSISKNRLQLFEWGHLGCFPDLEELDLSKNLLDFVAPQLLTAKLKVLNLSHNRIFQLTDGFLEEARSLRTLDLSYNKLQIINHSTFLSKPDNHMKELLVEGNPFDCTCNIIDFILWMDKSEVDIPRLATGVTCQTPLGRKHKAVIYFDINECVNDNKALMLYLVSTSFILSSLAIAITLHLVYWDVTYAFHYWKAKIKGYRYLKVEDSIFDAFVTYDTKDPLVSDWVLNHLMVQLEECGERAMSVCLEERNWSPGIPIMDNLSQSIHQSRKTVFVLTDAYVRSGTFRMAIYLAHQRLLDDNVDVMVLLLLEPVLQHSRFLRLRKRLCEHSVLEWPRNPWVEPWFWHNLRNAIRVDSQYVYSNLYTNYFTTT